MTAPNDVPNAADVSDADLVIGRERYRRRPWLARGAAARYWETLSAGTWFNVSEEFACVLDALAADRAALLAQRAADAGEVERLREALVECQGAFGVYGSSLNWRTHDLQHVWIGSADGRELAHALLDDIRAALAPAAVEAPNDA